MANSRKNEPAISLINGFDNEKKNAIKEIMSGAGQQILTALKQEKSLTQLSNEMNLAPSTIFWHIERLMKLNLVEEVKREFGDRREKYYSATKLGLVWLPDNLNLTAEERAKLERDLAAIITGHLGRRINTIRGIVSAIIASALGLEIWNLYAKISSKFVIPSSIALPFQKGLGEGEATRAPQEVYEVALITYWVDILLVILFISILLLLLFGLPRLVKTLART
ncbi:MAG: winged helix-turn-helix domain-containing protein [Euryarchaeota archaeon]|nr:winged helix-turn-helix domain-containing protein [Euryarchaeota archaeon]